MNNRRDTYLREMEARLRHLPEADRAEEMAEITQHLDTLIAACQTEGKTQSDATEDAIARFGAARDIGSRLYQADKHKRFAPLVEVGLFCAIFSALLEINGQGLWHAVQASAYALALRGTIPEAAAQHFLHLVEPRVGAWMPIGWPVSWLVGLGSAAVLVARHGARGTFEEARHSPSVNAALRWLFFVSLFELLSPVFFIHRLYGAIPFARLNLTQQVSVNALNAGVSILVAFVTAYLIGRASKARESIADAVGCAVVAHLVIGMVQMVFNFVPTPWQSLARPFSLLSNPTAYLIGFLWMIFYSGTRLFSVHFGVRLGEKSRLLLVSVSRA